MGGKISLTTMITNIIDAFAKALLQASGEIARVVGIVVAGFVRIIDQFLMIDWTKINETLTKYLGKDLADAITKVVTIFHWWASALMGIVAQLWGRSNIDNLFGEVTFDKWKEQNKGFSAGADFASAIQGVIDGLMSFADSLTNDPLGTLILAAGEVAELIVGGIQAVVIALLTGVFDFKKELMKSVLQFGQGLIIALIQVVISLQNTFNVLRDAAFDAAIAFNEFVVWVAGMIGNAGMGKEATDKMYILKDAQGTGRLDLSMVAYSLWEFNEGLQTMIDGIDENDLTKFLEPTNTAFGSLTDLISTNANSLYEQFSSLTNSFSSLDSAVRALKRRISESDSYVPTHLWNNNTDLDNQDIIDPNRFGDFIWRPGTGAVAFSPNDTIIGMQGGMGGGTTVISPTININGSGLDQQTLKRVVVDVIEETASRASRNGRYQQGR